MDKQHPQQCIGRRSFLAKFLRTTVAVIAIGIALSAYYSDISVQSGFDGNLYGSNARTYHAVPNTVVLFAPKHDRSGLIKKVFHHPDIFMYDEILHPLWSRINDLNYWTSNHHWMLKYNPIHAKMDEFGEDAWMKHLGNYNSSFSKFLAQSCATFHTSLVTYTERENLFLMLRF